MSVTVASKVRQDLVEQLVWRARAIPVRLGSRVAPRAITRGARHSTRLHLGCGSSLVPGWANLDIAGPKGVIRFDLSCPLPFSDGSVDIVYSEHFIEHLRKDQALDLLAECARVLRHDGVLRISTPDLRVLVNEYIRGDTAEWADMEWTPASPCDLLNEGLRLWGHLYVWDETELLARLRDAGFQDVKRVGWRDSEHFDLRGLECRPHHGDLIVEATR